MKLVLDTNIVLDLFVFQDPRAADLRAAIASGQAQWFASAPMREELACVLSYEQMGAWLERGAISAAQVLRTFDEHATLVAPPPGAGIKCRDPDDQKFVDLAVAHGALLLSKDRELLALRRKLPVASAFSALPPPRSGPAAPSASTS